MVPPPQSDSAAFELRDGMLLAEARVPLTDRGFRYGQHFFETLPVRQGRWQFYPEHLQRLQQSARAAGFPPLSAASAEALVTLPARPEFSPWPLALVRLFWTAGDGPPSAPPAAGRFFIFLETMEPVSTPHTLRLVEAPGVCLGPGCPGSPSSASSPDTSVEGAWKTGNYWEALRTLATAKDAGADEALRFNLGDRLVGVCLGNVFFRKNDQWRTPPLRDGARPGVAREWLLRRGFAREASCSREEARTIREWVVCNSRLGPTPATWATGPEMSPAPVLADLWREFHAA